MLGLTPLASAGAPGNHVYLLISGFNTEGFDPETKWAPILSDVTLTGKFFAVRWEAGSMAGTAGTLVAGASIGAMLGAKLGGWIGSWFEDKEGEGDSSRESGAAIGALLGGVGGSAGALQLKFEHARRNCETAAVQLAEMLAGGAFAGSAVTLIGHSLGGRMILHALAHARDRKLNLAVHDVVLMGAACTGDGDAWAHICDTGSGVVLNLHSLNDRVLSKYAR